MEGWKEKADKVKEKADLEARVTTFRHLEATATTSSHQEDQQNEDFTQEA